MGGRVLDGYRAEVSLDLCEGAVAVCALIGVWEVERGGLVGDVGVVADAD